MNISLGAARCWAVVLVLFSRDIVFSAGDDRFSPSVAIPVITIFMIALLLLSLEGRPKDRSGE